LATLESVGVRGTVEEAVSNRRDWRRSSVEPDAHVPARVQTRPAGAARVPPLQLGSLALGGLNGNWGNRGRDTGSTLDPKPYTLHPEPYTLHPTP
ncbi:hypothetical protein T484DRAFT_1883921, partial [Baffinella frigidus]